MTVRSAGGRLALPAVGIAGAAASVAVVAALPSAPITSYASVSPWAAAADLAAGLGLIVAGSVVAAAGRSGSIAPLAVAAGLVWLAADWVGWDGGPATVRSLALALPPFLLPLVIHLAVAFPQGRLPAGRGRWLVGVAYAMAAFGSVGRALVRDPLLDLNCWSDCRLESVFLLRSDVGLSRVVDVLWLASSVVLGVALAAICSRRLARASAVGRRALWFVLAPAAIVGLAEAARSSLLLADPAEDPERAVFAVVFFGRAFALLALAVGVSWSVLRAVRTGRRVARLTAELSDAPPPGSLQGALAASLGDPSLEVAHWLPASGRFVKASGRPADPRSDRERATTSIVRGGAPVAVVMHDRALYGDDGLAGEIGAAVRLAIDNERLRAELLAQLEDLRASRSRIVEAGDAARRRMERDLHDGAQQRLLAVTFELRLARAAAGAAGDEELAAAIDMALKEMRHALAELRELAHGIFPAILDQGGLGSALSSLADRSAVPISFEELPDERLPPGVERAAYLVVIGAVRTDPEADEVRASVRREGDTLVVDLSGVDRAPPLQVADRVGSLGGRMVSRPGGLRAEIPCG